MFLKSKKKEKIDSVWKNQSPEKEIYYQKSERIPHTCPDKPNFPNENNILYNVIFYKLFSILK